MKMVKIVLLSYLQRNSAVKIHEELNVSDIDLYQVNLEEGSALVKKKYCINCQLGTMLLRQLSISILILYLQQEVLM